MIIKIAIAAFLLAWPPQWGHAAQAPPAPADLQLFILVNAGAGDHGGSTEAPARLAAALKSRRIAGGSGLLLAGGYWPAAGETSSLGRERIAAFLRHLGPQAIVFGANEFGASPQELKALVKVVGCPALTSNVVDGNGNSMFQPYKAFRAAGVKLTMFGVWPSGDNYYHFSLRDPVRTVGALRMVLRREIGLAVAIMPADWREGQRLAAAVPEIDLVITADGKAANGATIKKRDTPLNGISLLVNFAAGGPGLAELTLHVQSFNPGDWDITSYEFQEIAWQESAPDETAERVLRGEALTPTAVKGK